ncbi:pigment-dispersing hormone 1 peptides-like [Cherax quadricarinatus]
MHSSVMVVVLMVLVMATVFTQAQDLKYPERQVVTELAAQIMRVAQGPWSTSLDLPTKRNSGLINSLLGIPKVMNDAGRR